MTSDGIMTLCKHRLGAAAAKLAPSKPGMVVAWLGVPVRTLLVTVGNRADSEGVKVATVLSKLSVSTVQSC